MWDGFMLCAVEAGTHTVQELWSGLSV